MVLKLDFFEKTSEQCYSIDNWRKRDDISMRIENRSNNLNLFVNKQKYTEFKNTTSNYFVSLYWNEVSFWVNFDPKIHFFNFKKCSNIHTMIVRNISTIATNEFSSTLQHDLLNRKSSADCCPCYMDGPWWTLQYKWPYLSMNNHSIVFEMII